MNKAYVSNITTTAFLLTQIKQFTITYKKTQNQRDRKPNQHCSKEKIIKM